MQRLLCMVVFYLIIFDNAHAQCSYFNPCGLTGGNDFREPEVLQSVDGNLELTLTVEMANLTFDWFSTIRRTYNGSVPGPTWRIRPGDNVTVTLVNNLEPSVGLKPQKLNKLQFPNITNLHTHGLHISSQQPQDDVFIHVEPGESYTYRYQIVKDHPAGTYWYHAHVHGSTTFQVKSGLAGIIIIEDPTTGPAAMPQYLAAISCPNNCEHEVPLIFQPVLQYADVTTFRRGFAQIQEKMEDDILFRNLEITNENITLAEWLSDVPNGFDYQTTNGEVFPVLTIPTGQRKRFRMINGGGSKTLEAVITDENGTTPTTGCDVWEIAYDGIYLNEAKRPKLGKSLLNSGSRVDWVVVCNSPGVYELRSVPDELDSCSLGLTERYNNVLLTITVTDDLPPPAESGTPPAIAFETNLPIRPSYVSNFLDVAESEIYRERFVIEASFERLLNRHKFSGDDDFQFRFPVGSIQEWNFLNTDSEDGHPMHIHVNHFQIVSYNTYTGPISTYTTDGEFTTVFYSEDGDICPLQAPSHSGGSSNFLGMTRINGTSTPCAPGTYVDHAVHSTRKGRGTIGYVEPGEFRDVLTIPPLSNITIRFKANQFTGRIVIHCHTSIHADGGMIMVTEVVNKDADTSVSDTFALDDVGRCYPSAASPMTFNLLLLVFVLVTCCLV